jgi:fido (protein-threonine AMPylation protein)
MDVALDEIWAAEQVDPVLAAAKVLHLLCRIHPFVSGNGRLSRFLANIILSRNNAGAVMWRDAVGFVDALASSDPENSVCAYLRRELAAQKPTFKHDLNEIPKDQISFFPTMMREWLYLVLYYTGAPAVPAPSVSDAV